MDNVFEASLWKSKSKYELRVSRENRELFFDRKIEYVNLLIPEIKNSINCKIRKSFWNKCSHFGNHDFLNWLKQNNLVPYVKGSPPKFKLTKIDNNNYQLTVI